GERHSEDPRSHLVDAGLLPPPPVGVVNQIRLPHHSPPPRPAPASPSPPKRSIVRITIVFGDLQRQGGVVYPTRLAHAYPRAVGAAAASCSWVNRSTPLSVCSGFSRMNDTAISANNAIGAPTRNSSAVATAYTSWTICRTGAGSSARLGTLAVPPPPPATGPNRSVSCAVTRLARRAPRALTPTAPPMLRKNVTTEVATPRSCAGTSFWAASTRFWMSRPTPTPSTAMWRDKSGTLVSASSVPRSSIPATSIAPPATRHAFQRPYFVMSCPATVEETSVPNTIGRLIQPATVGDLPSESWKYWDRKTVLPNIATPTRALASVASAPVRLRKILSGMIGSAARASTRIASASSTTPAMTIVALQPDAQANVLPASDDQISSTETPAVI